jgi:hypothetical protein
MQYCKGKPSQHSVHKEFIFDQYSIGIQRTYGICRELILHPEKGSNTLVYVVYVSTSLSAGSFLLRR